MSFIKVTADRRPPVKGDSRIEDGLKRIAGMKTYFILSPAVNRVKIGRSIDPDGRMRDLQVGSASPLVMLGHVDIDLEAELHVRFADYGTGGEWFEVRDVLRHLLRDLFPYVMDQMERAAKDTN
jgi:hypothetical protein